MSPPQVSKDFSIPKRTTKKLFMGGLLGKIYGDGYIERLMIRSCQGRGSFINAFSNNLITANLFPNDVGIFALMIKPWPELWKELSLKQHLIKRFLRLYLVHFSSCWPWTRALINYYSRYSSFCIFNYPRIYQICDVMMGISTWDRVHFSVFQCCI